MGLADRIQTFAAAALSAALMTCTSAATGPEPLTPSQKIIKGEQSAPLGIEGDALDFAVRRSFYHAGRFEYEFIDLLAQEPRLGRHDYEAQFFITEMRNCYIGVIHLHDGSHEIDVMVGGIEEFPSQAPGACQNVAIYHEFGGEHIRLQPEREQESIVIRGAPERVDAESAVLMFGQFLTMYTRAVQDLRVQKQIMADYRASQE